MRTLAILTMCFLAAAAWGCTKTTVTVNPVRETEMKEGAARVVDAADIEETAGVTSKPAEGDAIPDNPAAQGKTPVEMGGSSGGTDSTVQKKTPTPVIPKYDEKQAQKLLDEMQEETEQEKTERDKKFDELVKQVRDNSIPEAERKELEKKFEEGEKLHSEGKFKEAAAAYCEVLDKLPTHEGALERLKQCYHDMEKAGDKPAMIKKPASPRDVLLLEQKFAAAVSLYEDDQADEALKKFEEVVEMITFSRTDIDTKDILPKARDYIEKIKIEKELGGRQPAKEEKKEPPKPDEEKKPAGDEKKDAGNPGQPEKKEEPKPGGVAPF
jgi:hypothetical protein